MTITYEVDKQAGADLANRLVSASENKTGIFQREGLVPELTYPKNVQQGTLEHGLYLIYGCQYDSLRQSVQVWNKVRTLAEKGFFATLADRSVEDVEASLIAFGIYPDYQSPAENMVACATKLREEYGGDPRKIFHKAPDFETARMRLMEFKGFGRQKSVEAVKNFYRFGYTEWAQPDFPPKIDRHAIRISIGNGVIMAYSDGHALSLENLRSGKVKQQSTHRDRFTRLLEPLYREVCKEQGASPIIVDDAKYTVGSQVCTQNSFRACEHLCPLDCEMLVRTKEHTSYIILPSERRRRQMSLFNDFGEYS